MACVSGREMCLSQSQPLDHRNTFDLFRNRDRKLGGGEVCETEKQRDGDRVSQHNVSIT